MDMLAQGSFVFELKTVEELVHRHRSQLKSTALGDDGMTRFEDHARRFLQHTRLESIHWINVTRAHVTFRTLNKERTGR